MEPQADWEGVRARFRRDLARITGRTVEELPAIVDAAQWGTAPGDRRRRRRALGRTSTAPRALPHVTGFPTPPWEEAARRAHEDATPTR
jgi:hypothetical protein